MVKELDTFRQKYPQYADMDDATLATKLAAKYPEYKDLPSLVPQAAASTPAGAEPVTGGSFLGSLKEAASNIPGSAVQFGKDITTPILHPVETVKAIGGLATGGVQKLIPGEQGKEENWDAFIGAMKDRYGGIEQLKQTAIKDPVGFAADLATLFTGGGTVVRGAGVAGKLPALAKAGETVAKVGQRLEPVNIVREGLRTPARLVPEAIPESMYKSSAKFSTVLPEKERVKLTKTALDEGIPPTIKGLDQTRRKIQDLNTQITTKIEDAVTSGQKIPVDRLFKDFDALKKQILSVSGEPIKSAKAFDRVRSEIKLANEKLGRPDLTPMEAQKIKQRIYKELDKEYNKVSLHPANAEARMAVAKAAKEELENIIPEIKQLNAKEGDLIALQKAIERSSSRISNRDVFGIGIPIKGGAGGMVAGPEGFIAGLAMGLLDTPQVKARLAIVLNNLKNKGIKVRPTPTLTRLGLAQAGRSPGIKDDSDNP